MDGEGEKGGGRREGIKKKGVGKDPPGSRLVDLLATRFRTVGKVFG